MRSLEVTLLPDREKYPHAWPMKWWLVEVWERYPPPAEEGLHWLLWTKQPASTNNISRAVALSKKDPTFMFVVDDPQVVDWVEQAAAASNTRLRIAVSVFAGMTRKGIAAGEPAVTLAQKVAASKRMEFEGFMAYSGGAAHTRTWEARRKRSEADLAGVRESVELARKRYDAFKTAFF